MPYKKMKIGKKYTSMYSLEFYLWMLNLLIQSGYHSNQ